MSVAARGPRVAVAVAAALLLCACKGKGPPPAQVAGPEPFVIKFSDPTNYGIIAYAKRERIFERELAKVNARIEWVPAAGAFSANFDAMNSGAITASQGAISPVIGALSHNLQFKIFGIADRAGSLQAGIVAPAGSPIKSVKDLPGKRVAVNWAAHGDYILLKALEEAGIPAASVTRLPIQPPDAAAAFATGKIDAWSTFGVFYTTAVRNGARVLVREPDLKSDDVTVYAASVAVLERNPAAFLTLLRVARELTAEANRSPEKFQNVFTDKGPAAVSGDNLRAAIEDTRALSPPRVPTAADRARVGRVAKIFFDNKSIDRNIPADDIVFNLDAAASRLAARAP